MKLTPENRILECFKSWDKYHMIIPDTNILLNHWDFVEFLMRIPSQNATIYILQVVMKELDQDLSSATSKHVDQFLDQPIDLVVTVWDGAKESCPSLPRVAEALHWPFFDPADAEGNEQEQMQVFREVRDEIRTRIEHYLADSDV